MAGFFAIEPVLKKTEEQAAQTYPWRKMGEAFQGAIAMTREIEVMNIKVVVPEHKRFIRSGSNWHFINDIGGTIPLVDEQSDEAAFESACCIAIVAWESKEQEPKGTPV